MTNRVGAGVALLLCLGAATAAEARSYADTCAIRALRRAWIGCFRARGACTYDAEAQTICWPSGARAELSGDGGEWWLSAGGRRCFFRRTEINGVGSLSSTTTYRRGRKTWTVMQVSDGLDVTCPGGGTQDVTRDELGDAACGVRFPRVLAPLFSDAVPCEPGSCPSERLPR